MEDRKPARGSEREPVASSTLTLAREGNDGKWMMGSDVPLLDQKPS